MTLVLSDPFVGRMILGRYRIIRLIATGGMGKIYLARSEGAAGFIKPMVVKLVLPNLVGNDSMVRMFIREAKLLANLRHPVIVAVTDFARESNDYVMVMEYVHGYNLARWLRYVTATRNQFPVEVAVYIVLQVLDALHYAHTLTDVDGSPMVIVHRDVTPGNVLIDTRGHVKLLDFGIARSNLEVTDPDGNRPQVKGKFAYIAPEIFTGADPSPQTDVYSAAVLLHEVIAGRNEFTGKSMQDTVYNVLRHSPTRLDQIRPDVPLGLAEVVAQGMAKQPQERFQSAYDFSVALRAVRTMGADRAAEEIARLAAQDFAASGIAEMSGIDDLFVLDHAWRDSLTPPPPTPKELTSERDPTVPTLSSTPIDVTRPVPSAHNTYRIRVPMHWVLTISTGLFLCITVGLSALLMFRSRNHSAKETPYESIRGSNSAPGGTNGSTASGKSTGTNVPLSERSTPPLSKIVMPVQNSQHPYPGERELAYRAVTGQTRGQTIALTRAFAQKRLHIRQCFEQNPHDVLDTPEISVHFQLTPDGRASDVSLVPPELSSTPFAACILAIARSVDFGHQDGPIAFRIPITVRPLGTKR